MESWTALIPAIAGAPILLSSLLAKNPNKLKLGKYHRDLWSAWLSRTSRAHHPNCDKGRFRTQAINRLYDYYVSSLSNFYGSMH